MNTETATVTLTNRKRSRHLYIGIVLLLQMTVQWIPATAHAVQVCTSETLGNQDFRGISGSSDSNIIGVGRKGTIFRQDGSGWSPMLSPTNEDLNDVEVVDSTTAFAVGKDGTALQLVANVWIDHTGFTNEDLLGVWAASATEAYVVGKKGTLYSYDGAAWTDESAAAGTDNRDLEDAWGDANAFYAMSDRGELYRYDRVTGTWGPRDSLCNAGGSFSDLWGDAAGNLYLVRNEEIYRHDGASCSVVATASENLEGIYGSSADGQVYAGGRKGTVLHFDGASWTESTEAGEHIEDVWVSPAGNAYYSGRKGEITSCQNVLPTVVADWHLDECTLGIAGSSVFDSGPNALGGTVVGGLDIENTGQLCSAAAFDGTSSYVSVPDSAALDITAGISIAVWVRHNASVPGSWEAILAKGDSAYRLHLNGGCGIADTLPGNVPLGFTLGLNGGCSGADLNSNIVPVPGVWYHVAGTYDGATMRIYVDGLLISSASYSASINSNNFDLFIGENSQQRNRYWDGDIDELTIWTGAITPADVTNHMNRTRPCTNCSNISFLINHDNYGIHCLAETIQVDIVDSLTAAPRTDYNEQITLDSQTGDGTWVLVSGGGTFADTVAGDGLATYDWPLGESSAVFSLDYRQGATTVDIDVYQTSDPLLRDDDSEGPITFSASGFTLTEAPLSNPPPAFIAPFMSPRTAGTDFGVYLTAYGQTPTDPVCGVIETYTGPQNLKFWFTRDDPASGSVALSIDAAAIADNEAGAGNQAVNFTNGQAAVTAKYKDAGRILMAVKDDSLLHPDLPTGIRGSTASLPVKPFRFALSNIEDGGGTPNPGAADASGPVFLAAGEAFSVTVTALDAEGDVTPNFGQEATPESVRLESALVSPAGGNDPGIAPLLGFGPFSGGTATGSAFTWQEVGVISLLPSIGDADYLGGGDVAGTVSGNVGRFIPDRFTTANNAPQFSTQCGSGSFTYTGQSFGYSVPPVITFNAVSVGGAVTQNYTGSFFKVSNTTLQNRNYNAATGTLDLLGLPAVTVDPAVADTGAGTGTLLFSAGSGLAFLRTLPVPPFDADISLGIDLIDGDAVTALSNPVVVSSIGFDSGASIRFGRARLMNALGSELVNLAVPMRAEYFIDASSGFGTHTDDNCTTPVTLSLGSFTANLQAGETCVLDGGSPGSSGAGCAAPGPAGQSFREPPLGGDFNLFLQAPGAGNDGSTVITGDVPPWLEFDWDGALPGLEDPSAIATFGIYDGDGRRIYTRELY